MLASERVCVSVSHVSKRHGAVVALSGVSLEIRAGEVHALLGANGAGKSSLVKILAGVTTPDEGTIELDGRPVAFSNGRDAARHGVAIVSQELNLFPDLDVLQNLFIGSEPRRWGIIDRREMRRRAQPVLDAISLEVPVTAKLGSLTLAQRQLVEIGRALLERPRILILDEPTSALATAETERLLAQVRGLRQQGLGIVYVSHFLEEVFSIADTVTILRNGRAVIEDRPTVGITIDETIVAMLGEASREPEPRPPGRARELGPRHESGTLSLRGVGVRGMLQPVDLEAQPGEVVGLAGLQGSGVEAVFDVLFGRRTPDVGTVTHPDGRSAPIGTPANVRAGVAYVPSDRQRLGLMLYKPIYENVTIVAAGPLRRLGVFLRRREMAERAARWRAPLDIDMASPRAEAFALSGGNQQKVVLAKWLETDPEIVLLDDPTRGVDVGAKADIGRLVAQLAAERRVVLFTSSDLDEMARVCDRVFVFFQRQVRGELAGSDLSEHVLLHAITTGVLGENGREGGSSAQGEVRHDTVATEGMDADRDAG